MHGVGDNHTLAAMGAPRSDAKRLLHFSRGITLAVRRLRPSLDHGEMIEHVAEILLQTRHLAPLPGDFGVKFLSAALVIRFPATQNTMDDDAIVFNVEEHAVISRSQPIIAVEISQPFDVAAQPGGRLAG